jgi:hypothetical protein
MKQNHNNFDFNKNHDFDWDKNQHDFDFNFNKNHDFDWDKNHDGCWDFPHYGSEYPYYPYEYEDHFTDMSGSDPFMDMGGF